MSGFAVLEAYSCVVNQCRPLLELADLDRKMSLSVYNAILSDKKTKLRGLSPGMNYSARATAA
jgi:hypothetical protein